MDMIVQAQTRINTDASAAKGIANRKGAGKDTAHSEVAQTAPSHANTWCTYLTVG